MKHKNLIIALFVLVIVLSVILWIVAAKFVTRQKEHKVGAEKFQISTATHSLEVNTLASKVERMMEPASTRIAEEKERASGEFGAALDRAGIATQAEASH